VSTVTGNESTPAVSRSGHIFITTADGELVVLNPDKSEAARISVDSSGQTSRILASPVLSRAGDRVFVATRYSRKIAAYSVIATPTSATLSLLWSSTIPDPTGNEIRSTPALSGNESTLYVTTGKDIFVEFAGTGSLYAFSTADGSTPSGWTAPDISLVAAYAHSHLAASPVVLSDGKIVVVGGNNYGEIQAYYPNGTKAWSSPTHQGFFEGSPAVGIDNTIFIASQNGVDGQNNPLPNYLHCYNGSDGTLRWKVLLASFSKAGPVVTSFGEVVVPDNAGNVYGFSHDGLNAQGQSGWRWKFTLADWNAGSLSGVALPCQTPLVDAGGNVIVTGHDGWLISIKPDGTRRWTAATQVPDGNLINPAIGCATMTAKGEVLLFRSNGKLFSFQNEHGPDAGIWPGFQRGSTHSGNIGDNAVDRDNLSYTVSYFPGTPEMRWNSYYGYYEWITNYSTVNAVNDRGHVAGYSTASSWSTTQATEWFSGYTLTLQGPPYANDPDGSQAYGMNWRGDTVGQFGKGYYGTYGSGNSGILWERNGSGNLGQGYLLPWSYQWSGEAKALNSDKWIVGNGFNPNGTKRAVLWPYATPNSGGVLPTTMNDLGAIPGTSIGYWSESIGISAGRIIVGNSVAFQDSSTTTRPFRLDYNDHTSINGLTDELPDPGAAVGTTLVRLSQWIRGINENGQIVGTVSVDNSLSPTKAYIYRHSTSASLSYRVPPRSVVFEDGRNNIYLAEEAVAVNSRGQVLLKGARLYNPNQGNGGGFTLTIERPFYLLYTPARTGYYNVTRQVFPYGAQINGLTDDGKLYGYVYRDGLPTGFVAVPGN